MDERIRRTDLYLRARYPHLNTTIFRLSNGFYGILLNDFIGNFNELQKEFDRAIRPITTPVKLFENRPDSIEEELPVIKDYEIGNNFSGLPLTLSEVKYLLMAKFPMAEILHLEEFFDPDGKLNIYTDIILDENIKKDLINFLYSLDIPLKYYLIEDKIEGINRENNDREKREKMFSSIKEGNPLAMAYFDSLENPITSSLPTKLSKTKIIYEERDEQMLFDKLSDIYAGNFTKTDILNDINTSNSCYIDYSKC